MGYLLLLLSSVGSVGYVVALVNPHLLFGCDAPFRSDIFGADGLNLAFCMFVAGGVSVYSAAQSLRSNDVGWVPALVAAAVPVALCAGLLAADVGVRTDFS